MKKAVKYIFLSVVLLASLYAGFSLLLRNIELTIVLALFILAGITLVMLIYHIVNDIRTYKRVKEMNEFIEARKKDERIRELLDSIGGNRYGE